MGAIGRENNDDPAANYRPLINGLEPNRRILARVPGCCYPPAAALPVAEAGCCSGSGTTFDPLGAEFHARLTDLLARYDVNEFAASVRVFAVKP
jgi:hypothetical protein